MTATKPTQGQPASLDNAMLLNSIMGVAGTTGIETTMVSPQRADGIAVKLDRTEGQLTHFGFAPLQSR